MWGATGTLVSALNGITSGDTYYITASYNSKYYTVPNTTIDAQTFTCTEGSFNSNKLTPANGAGEFVFTAVSGVNNAYYIYNTNLGKYLVATGSKKFGYVDNTSSDYGYWTFSTVSSGGFSGVFSVQHSSKTHYMRAYNNSVRCYDGESNSGVYFFKKDAETKVATPQFSPAEGTYNNNQTVTISTTTTGASIYYTTNGDAPSSGSTLYEGPITVNASQTIKAIGIKDGLTNSDVAEAQYTMVVLNPSFNVTAGTYNEAKSVQLSCETTGATIRYTTNGYEPTENSPAYSEAIPVNVSQTIKAKAFKTGYTPSGEVSATYTLKCSTPAITKADGDFVTTKVITMTSSDGATIRYTTDGSTEPTTSVGTVYDPDNKPSINATTTIKAIAYKDGWTSSDVASETFTKETVLDGMTALVAITGTTATDYYVNLSNTQITWTNGNSIGYIEDASRGAYWSAYSSSYKPTLNNVYNNGIFKVKYQYSNQMPTIKYAIKVEGADPAVGSAKAPTVMTPSALDAAFTANLGRQIQINNFTVATGKKLTDNITIYDSGDYTSVSVGRTYTLVGYPYNNNGTKQFRVVTAVEAPTFSEEEGIFYDAFDLTLSCATTGADIYYTTDGSIPTTSSSSSTKYTAAFEISATTTVKAIAVKNGVASNVAEATYTHYAVKLPTFVTASPVYYNDKVTVSCETDEADIYYTLTTDESEPADPTSTSTAYPDGGITIAANTVKIKVIAMKGSDYSPVASATYTLKNPEAPTATPGAGVVEPGTTVTLSSHAGTSIYYTTNGDTPNNTSTAYTTATAITIDADKTIKAIAYDGAGNASSVLEAAYEIFTFSVADITMERGTQATPVVTTNSAGTVSFESGNTDIATIVDGKVNAVAKGTVTITASIAASGTLGAKSTTFTVTVKNPTVWEATSKGIDDLTYSTFGWSGTSNGYTNFSGKKRNSTAVYAGQAYKESNLTFIQIRTTNSNSGIVTTTSGGKARKVVVSWTSSKGSNGNTIDIYGKATAYSSASDLFGNADAQGTKLGSIVRGTSTELSINDDYAFIGIRSNSGTCYLDEIDIYWEGDAVTLSDASDYDPVAKDYAKVTLNRKFVAGWNGIVLPFDLTESVKTALGASQVKTLGSATLEGDVITLNFTNETLPVAAGKPVLVKLGDDPLESGDVILNGVEIKTTNPQTVVKDVEGSGFMAEFTLTGTYSSVDLARAEAYFVSNDTFYHKAEGVDLTAAPFRAYIIQETASNARKTVNFNLDGETAGIVEMNANVSRSNNYYDMQGRRVAQPRRGLYIVNGKKVLVK